MIDWSKLTQQFEVIRKDHAHLAGAFDFETMIESYMRWIEALSRDVTPIELHAQIRQAKERLLHEAKETKDDSRWFPIEIVHDELQKYIRISNKMMDVYPELFPGDFPNPSVALGHRTRFGGQPRWIQPTDYPSCEACGSPMPFVGQIDSVGLAKSENTKGSFKFSDAGMIYIFHCCGSSKVIDSSS